MKLWIGGMTYKGGGEGNRLTGGLASANQLIGSRGGGIADH
jgi:hypothetical protein